MLMMKRRGLSRGSGMSGMGTEVFETSRWFLCRFLLVLVLLLSVVCELHVWTSCRLLASMPSSRPD